MYISESILRNWICEGFLAWGRAVITLPWVDAAIEIFCAPASSITQRNSCSSPSPCCQVLAELTPRYQEYETQSEEMTWDELELRWESNSCIQADLQLDIWKRGTQMLRPKGLKWHSGLLASGTTGDRAPWWTLAMGVALWGAQGHHVPVKIWSGGYQYPQIPALKTKQWREGHLVDLGLY